MLLLLVRHGLTDLTEGRLVGRTPGVHLNDRGRAQAAEAAARLRDLPLAAVASSPLERAVETAQPLAEVMGVEVRPVEGLLEIDYGDWTGQEFKVLQKTDLWKVVQQRPSEATFPGGESLRGAQTRVVTAVEEIRSRHGDEVVAVFTHADPIRLAVAHFTGIHLDLYQRLTVSPGSVTALGFGAAGPRLLRLNDTATLEDLRPRRRRRGKN